MKGHNHIARPIDNALLMGFYIRGYLPLTVPYKTIPKSQTINIQISWNHLKGFVRIFLVNWDHTTIGTVLLKQIIT